ncbi:phage tail tape measure protein [Mycolicibacterium sp. A43C]
MPILLKVGAQGDDRSFKQVADQAKRTFAAAGKEASESFAKQFAAGAKDVAKATSGYAKAYDSLADATGKATIAEKQRQQYLDKSKTLAKQVEEAEKKLNAARDSGDTKAASAAEKELQRAKEQSARTDTQLVKSAESVSSLRRREKREINDTIAAYRDLENAQRRAVTPGFGRTFDSYQRGQGAMSGVLSQSSGMVGQFNSLGGSAGKAFVGGAVAAILAGGLIQAGTKAAGMVVDGFKSVMDTGVDFSRTVNNFQGVTQSTAGQTSQMAAAARALGADTSMAGVSASDAASAMTELAKAGFTVDQAITAARGTMQLATAAQIDAARAAEIQANAINAFNLDPMKDAARVADVLANAAVGSSADIPDLALALQQVGGIANGFGEDIEGTAAALGMFANAGVKGSDAGTLLKTTLQSITDQGNPAQEAIKSLGLSLYNFDTGQFVGFRELFRQLDEAKSRMSPEQFQAESNVLFGSDAMRAAMLGTVADFDTMYETIGRVGTASNMAKAQMQGWPGVMEGIDNATEALKLSLYDLFDSAAGRDLGGQLVGSLDGLVDWVNTHKPEIVSFVSDFVSAWATGTDAFLTYVARIMQAGSYMQDALSHTVGSLLEGVSKMAAGVGSVIKHIPGMGEIGSNLEGAATAVDNIMDKWQNLGGTMRSGSEDIDRLREGIRGMRDGITGSLGEIALAESRTRNYATAFGTLKDAVELVPGTKEIILTDNTPEVRQKLTELGFAVQQLPNGQLRINVEYRDPSGRLVDPSQLGVSQRQLDDRTSRQHDWGLTPPAAPTTGPVGPWTPSGGRGGSGSGLPDAPVLPISYTNTAGMSPEMANAQNRVDETAHDLAEKQARLQQLEASNVASAEDVQKARNDVAKAQQDADIAQRRMQEAQMNAFGKSTKQMNGMASALGEIGAQLDSDFGISKGLAGIAENITRFVANLAAAPLIGTLSAIDKANPNEGSGLVGMLAANGAFGAQYTPTSLAASAMGPTMLQPGYGGYSAASAAGIDAALLSRVRPGSYVSEPGVGDLTQGIGDCTSAIEDLINFLDGQPTDGRSLSTGNAAEWLQQRGFLPGAGGPGDFRVAFNPSHAQATLPGGTPFNWGSKEAAARGGVGSLGADDPALTSRYYRPLGTSAPAKPTTTTTTSPTANPAATAAPSLTIPQNPVYNTNPALTPPLAGVPSMPGGPLGTGMPSAAPFAAPSSFSQSAPAVGLGNAYPSQGGGNSGNIMGGLALDGAMAATSGLDMLAPGAGAAAKIGIQLANRTIGYGAQNVGIGVSGLLETLSLGDNPLGSIGAGWAGKIAGGLAGAAPALPNMAGQKPPGQPGGGEGGQGGSTVDQRDQSIHVTNNGATENQNGKTIAEHRAAMFAPTGAQG